MRPARRPSLCLVTDRRRLAPDARTLDAQIAALEQALDEAVDAGIDWVQIREPDVPPAVLVGLVERVLARAAPTATRLVVNDRADIARVTGAAGVHVRADGPAIARLRTFGPPTWCIGRSLHAAAEVAPHATADYLLFGTLFPSRSKPLGAPTQTLDILRAVVAASPVPVWAIGGITPDRARACLEAGAAGIAAIGAFLDGGARPGGVRERVNAMRRAVGAGFLVE